MNLASVADPKGWKACREESHGWPDKGRTENATQDATQEDVTQEEDTRLVSRSLPDGKAMRP